ncbi:MAG: glucosyltransferase [Clostridia bacterium]|nr:glucosyltransferase [Clostridia bacterium]
MSRIVFFCIPAHGHTNPTLGVVRELTARGHEVVYYSYEMMRGKIEAAGARFVSCDAYDTEQRLTPKDAARIGKDLAFSTKVLVDTTLALDDIVCAQMQELKPDCIVADSMAVWGKAVALKLGIPFVSSTTTFAFNQHSAKIMPQSVGTILSAIFSMGRAQREIRRLQAHGYPVKSALDIIQNDEHTHTIVYTSPQFQPCADTFTEKYAFVGPSVRPAGSAFEKTHDKLLYISMGTVNNDMLPLYRACIAAFADAPYQVVISAGEHTDIAALGPLPPHISVYPKVDQIAVLQQADAFITHCGMNSASEALYFGVPLVTVPVTDEQKGVAARALQLGAAVKPASRRAKALRQAADTALGDPSYRRAAQAVAQGLRACPGASGAADKILAVIAEAKG